MNTFKKFISESNKIRTGKVYFMKNGLKIRIISAPSKGYPAYEAEVIDVGDAVAPRRGHLPNAGDMIDVREMDINLSR